MRETLRLDTLLMFWVGPLAAIGAGRLMMIYRPYEDNIRNHPDIYAWRPCDRLPLCRIRKEALKENRPHLPAPGETHATASADITRPSLGMRSHMPPRIPGGDGHRQ